MTGEFATLIATSRHLVRIRLMGHLDSESAAGLVELARAELDHRPGLRHLHLDCARLTGCDPLGLSGLLGLRRDAGAAGVTLYLDRRTTAFEQLLERTGILRHLTEASDAERRDDTG